MAVKKDKFGWVEHAEKDSGSPRRQAMNAQILVGLIFLGLIVLGVLLQMIGP